MIKLYEANKLFSYYKGMNVHDVILKFLKTMQDQLTAPVGSESGSQVEKFDNISSFLSNVSYEENFKNINDNVGRLVTRFESSKVGESWDIGGDLIGWLITQLEELKKLYGSMDVAKDVVKSILNDFKNINVTQRNFVYDSMRDDIIDMFDGDGELALFDLVNKHNYTESDKDLLDFVSEYKGVNSSKFKRTIELDYKKGIISKFRKELEGPGGVATIDRFKREIEDAYQTKLNDAKQKGVKVHSLDMEKELNSKIDKELEARAKVITLSDNEFSEILKNNRKVIEREVISIFINKMIKRLNDIKPDLISSNYDYRTWIQDLDGMLNDGFEFDSKINISFHFISEVESGIRSQLDKISKNITLNLSDKKMLNNIQDDIFKIQSSIIEKLGNNTVGQMVNETIKDFLSKFNDEIRLIEVDKFISSFSESINVLLASGIDKVKIKIRETITTLKKLVTHDLDDAEHANILKETYDFFASLDLKLLEISETYEKLKSDDDAEDLEWDLSRWLLKFMNIYGKLSSETTSVPSYDVESKDSDVWKKTTKKNMRDESGVMKSEVAMESSKKAWKRSVGYDEFVKENHFTIDAWFNMAVSLFHLMSVKFSDDEYDTNVSNFNVLLNHWHMANSHKVKYALQYVDNFNDWKGLSDEKRLHDILFMIEEIRSRCHFEITALNDAIVLFDSHFKPYVASDEWAAKWIKEKLQKNELNKEWKEHLALDRAEYTRIGSNIKDLIVKKLLTPEVIFKVTVLFSNLLNKTVGGLTFSSEIYDRLNEYVLSNGDLVGKFMRQNLIHNDVRSPREFAQWYPGLNRMFDILLVKFRFGERITLKMFIHIVGWLRSLEKISSGLDRNNLSTDLLKLEKFYKDWFVKYGESKLAWRGILDRADEFEGSLNNDELWIFNELKAELDLNWTEKAAKKLIHPTVRKAIDMFVGDDEIDVEATEEDED